MHDNGGTESPNNKGPGTSSSSIVSAVTGKHLDVEELEMLLEAYFVQIDGTLNKLSTVSFALTFTADIANIANDIFYLKVITDGQTGKPVAAIIATDT